MTKLNNLTIHAIRLKPATDLLKQLATLVTERNIRAGFIISACGSLTRAALRLASLKEANEIRCILIEISGSM
jgi:predicted DNA-binding protein with PD1-like motif